jgi:hypothetical protein
MAISASSRCIGRFNMEIAIGAQDDLGHQEILLSTPPLSDNVDLERIVDTGNHALLREPSIASCDKWMPPLHLAINGCHHCILR